MSEEAYFLSLLLPQVPAAPGLFPKLPAHYRPMVRYELKVFADPLIPKDIIELREGCRLIEVVRA